MPAGQARGWVVNRLGPVAVLVGSALLAAACGGSAGVGMVVGTARMYGGPAVQGGGQTLNGVPLPNSSVSLWSKGRRVASTTTDAQGRFTLTAPPGIYDAVQACGGLEPLPDTLTLAKDQTTQHDITCPVP